MALPEIPKPSVRTLAILIGLLGIVLIARAVVDRPMPRPAQAARAILAGKAQARAALDEAAEDSELVDDEAAAGAIWGANHLAREVEECPDYSTAFRKGCADYMHGKLP